MAPPSLCAWLLQLSQPGLCCCCPLLPSSQHHHAEGVLQAEKDFNLESHPEIADVPNLHVIKLMQSFKSKELVTERFAWRHYYWCVCEWGVC